MKKGFTLVELLAVIVILALVALITIPVILNVIEKSKTKTYYRSIESYGKAIEKGIAEYIMDYMDNNVNESNNENSNDTNSEAVTPKNITVEYLENHNYIKYEGNSVHCNTALIYEDKTIYLSNCTVNGESVSYSYGEQQNQQNNSQQDNNQQQQN